MGWGCSAQLYSVSRSTTTTRSCPSYVHLRSQLLLDARVLARKPRCVVYSIDRPHPALLSRARCLSRLLPASHLARSRTPPPPAPRRPPSGRLSVRLCDKLHPTLLSSPQVYRALCPPRTCSPPSTTSAVSYIALVCDRLCITSVLPPPPPPSFASLYSALG